MQLAGADKTTIHHLSASHEHINIKVDIIGSNAGHEHTYRDLRFLPYLQHQTIPTCPYLLLGPSPSRPRGAWS